MPIRILLPTRSSIDTGYIPSPSLDVSGVHSPCHWPAITSLPICNVVSHVRFASRPIPRRVSLVVSSSSLVISLRNISSLILTKRPRDTGYKPSVSMPLSAKCLTRFGRCSSVTLAKK